MKLTSYLRGVVAILLVISAGPVLALGADGPRALGTEERERIERGLRELTAKIEVLRGRTSSATGPQRDRLADVEVFAKGIDWALRYDVDFTPTDVKLLSTAIDRLRSRVDAFEAQKFSWAEKKGKSVRGFVSDVDGSIQPYGVIVPASYDPRKATRLDVVLHGSSRPVGMSELRFMSRFDEGDGSATNAPDVDYIEVHPLGRVENGYRWAGETDVFEEIEAVCRNYHIDRDRIVLRGMSMGASGTWHLGLKHPDRFVALGPYCGYVDTHEFSNTPLPNFIKVGPLPSNQEKMLHLLDSVDYAANAGVVPSIACMGEKDIFFQAHEIMKRAMAKEGLTMVNLISPGTGHVQDPTTHKEQMRQIGEYAEKGLRHSPRQLRFVTWTLKYSRCHWLQVLGMEEQYARAELKAEIEKDRMLVAVEPKNVSRFAILPPVAASLRTVRIEGEEVPVLPRPDGAAHSGIVFTKREGRWACLGDFDRLRLEGKRPGLQGPIDDAFTTPFLCVRGTGTAWNPAVQQWADASLKRFAYEWRRYFRGELPIKDDTAVTAEDVRRCNLILFGDPGSNAWIARVLPRLPIHWTASECAIGNVKVAASGHAPMLIQPNPLADGRYVVLNSGHTFREKELASLNYLLFPRLGDWAIAKVPADPSHLESEAIVESGFFGEDWNRVLK